MTRFASEFRRFDMLVCGTESTISSVELYIISVIDASQIM